ncbi:MAG TPA: stage II sporulation protein M [Solirubrobacterales bacterium]|nr:stage II sporulation protein M [Solirubrobacterales bacterium]
MRRRLHRRRLDADRRRPANRPQSLDPLKAGQFAILFVAAVTLFSLGTQALYLGFQGSTLAYQLQISNFELILSVLPHALPELTALFLPLAAWLIASRRGEWNQLLAATFITVALAIPVLILAAAIEVYVWPQILEELSPGIRTIFL